MVGDDDEAAFGSEQVDRRGERSGQRFELPVDRDAQRLEDPRGGVDPASAARRGRCGALDDGRKLGAGLDGRSGSFVDDRPRDGRACGSSP